MAGWYVFGNNRTGCNHTIIANRYAFKNDTSHTYVASFTDDNGSSVARRFPEPAYIR